MRIHLRLTGIALIVIAAAVGCQGIVDADPLRAVRVGPADEAVLVMNGIRASLSVTPTSVAAGEAFEATMTLTNTLPHAATWTSGMGCLAFLDVLSDGVRVPARGTDFGCLGVVTIRELAAREAIAQTWQLAAATTDGNPLAPGSYRLRADPVIADHRTLSVPFTVR
jgi:hypothetical protein